MVTTQLDAHAQRPSTTMMILDILMITESIAVGLQKTTDAREVDSLKETDDPGVLAFSLLKAIIKTQVGTQVER